MPKKMTKAQVKRQLKTAQRALVNFFFDKIKYANSDVPMSEKSISEINKKLQLAQKRMK